MRNLSNIIMVMMMIAMESGSKVIIKMDGWIKYNNDEEWIKCNDGDDGDDNNDDEVNCS